MTVKQAEAVKPKFHPLCPKCGLPMKNYGEGLTHKKKDVELWGCKRHETKGVWLTIEGLETAGKMSFLYPLEIEAQLAKVALETSTEREAVVKPLTQDEAIAEIFKNSQGITSAAIKEGFIAPIYKRRLVIAKLLTADTPTGERKEE